MAGESTHGDEPTEPLCPRLHGGGFPGHPQEQARIRQFFWTKQVPPADLSDSHSWSASLFALNGPTCAA